MSHRQWQDASSLNKGKNEATFTYQKKYEQMSRQQQLIEEKKQEILRRQAEKKQKETEEALKKLNEDKKPTESSRSKRNYYGYSRGKHWRDKQEEQKPATLPANIFSNDGSFLEQFQKLSGIKVAPRKKSSDSQETSNGNNNEENEIEGNSEPSDDKKVDDEEEKNNCHQEVKPDVPKEKQPQEVGKGGFQQNQQQQQAIQNQQTMPPRPIHHQPMQQHTMPQPPIGQHHQNYQSQHPIHQYPQHMQHQQPLQHQQPMQHQQPLHQQPMHQQHMQHQQPMQQQQQGPPPPLQQRVFTPQQMPAMPPRMPMNYPQFNPMQPPHSMMLPPPMTPSSIPPPAPLNPGSIPSPSPLQPGSIPSPSPLQPYAIPPPSPLIPHSIPPPSPMVPHSIPPPSPLAPHSIPPPLPIRPQNIPPPLQQAPLFLNMVPPPPPPPVDEPKRKVESEESESSNEKQKKKKKKQAIKDNVKDLFKNDDYSSSEEEGKDNYYNPIKSNNVYNFDSDSEHDERSRESNSDKESNSEHKLDSLSELDSGQESQSANATKSELDITGHSVYGPVVIEDTQTQFPSDTKDSSNTGEAAPPDQSSEGESSTPLPHEGRVSGFFKEEQQQPYFWQEQFKCEPENSSDQDYETKYERQEIAIKSEPTEYKSEIKEEVEYKIKQETSNDGIKSEDPPKKKRRSRWASEEEKVDIQPPMLPTGVAPELPVVPPRPLAMPPRPPGMLLRPPALAGMRAVPPPPPPGAPPMPPLGQPGVVVPRALGGVNTILPQPAQLPQSVPNIRVPGMSGAMISKVTRSDPALIAYAAKSFGRTNLTDAEWKKAEEHYKINLLYQDMMRKKQELERLQAAGKHKYEYDSDEEVEGGTWEHKLRSAEMEATQLWADELTEAAKGKHHIGDFLPPDELARFMEKYEAMKEGREPDLSDYKEFKLKEDNVGFQMLQKLGWSEGQGLGPDGSGLVDPVNKATTRMEGQGLGLERPDDVDADDDEYDAYRKRMMLAYRFRPNPMNNPRRPYY